MLIENFLCSSLYIRPADGERMLLRFGICFSVAEKVSPSVKDLVSTYSLLLFRFNMLSTLHMQEI
jgi:hypothetical protein